MLSIVIPFHSDYQRVIPTLARIALESEKWSIKEVLLCHNGPNMEAVTALEPFAQSANSNIKVILLHTSEKGIGAAYRLGIQNASEPYVILSASDLPFGFSDLQGFFDYKRQNNLFPEFSVGSKLHPRSDISAYPLTRKIYSHLFYLTRRVVLGRGTPRDSQGTLIGSTLLFGKLLSQVHSQDYFFSLELLSLAIASGLSIIELPVVLENHEQESSVAPIGDGSKMFLRLFDLRQRLVKLASSS